LTDYVPVLVKEFEVRNFFNPPLDYDDVPTAELLLKIESVEKYIEFVYGITTSTSGRIPALLLVASKIVENPSLSSKYSKIETEKLGDYSYSLFKGGAASWRTMAIEMLEAKIAGSRSDKWNFLKVND
jgi:hypothetical protein